MANPYSPPNGLNQSLDYVIPDAGGNAGGASGDAGYMKRGKGTGGGYTVTGAADKSLNQVVETHQDGDTFSADPIEIVAAGVTDGGLTKAQGYVHQPNVFKTVSTAALGNTAVWTPTSGKKFRLLKLMVLVTDNASLASGGVLAIDIQDATTSTNLTFSVFIPTTAVTTVPGDAFNSGWIDLGGIGILSALANNVLNVNLGTALATGACRVIAAGTEE
jgi:hypothetical protein